MQSLLFIAFVLATTGWYLGSVLAQESSITVQAGVVASASVFSTISSVTLLTAPPALPTVLTAEPHILPSTKGVNPTTSSSHKTKSTHTVDLVPTLSDTGIDRLDTTTSVQPTPTEPIASTLTDGASSILPADDSTEVFFPTLPSTTSYTSGTPTTAADAPAKIYSPPTWVTFVTAAGIIFSILGFCFLLYYGLGWLAGSLDRLFRKPNELRRTWEVSGDPVSQMESGNLAPVGMPHGGMDIAQVGVPQPVVYPVHYRPRLSHSRKRSRSRLPPSRPRLPHSNSCNGVFAPSPLRQEVVVSPLMVSSPIMSAPYI